MSNGKRLAIRFDNWYRLLSTILLIFPSASYVTVDSSEVEVRMSWAFQSRFPRTAVVSAAQTPMRTYSRGVHGFGGRWLVNGSAQGLVTIDLEPAQRAYCMGIPIGLRQLIVSVEDASALTAALA
jgi:hypothetical protein